MLRLLAPLLDHPDYRPSRHPNYFASSLRALRSPLELVDLERGIGLLRAVMEQKGHILVLGDRDVDGVSSAALLGNFLREQHVKRGGTLDLRVSDLGDDYGLSGELFHSILASHADLVILLDMGSSHGPEIGELTKAGKKVIVLDHHQLGNRVPDFEDCAFINPQRNIDIHENEGKIPTVGLAFKFLFGYALSFLGEWETQTAVALDTFGLSGFALYRCGALTGIVSEKPDAAKELEPQTIAYLTAEIAKFPAEDSARIPVVIGSLLLCRLVEIRPRLLEFLLSLADLVSVGMVTDMVPLVGENRSLVRLGLGLSKHRSMRGVPGYRALMQELDLPDDLTGRDLAWTLGPTLNAAGRMGNTALAVRLLTSESLEEAQQLAGELKQLNKKRQDRTKLNEKIIAAHFEEHPALLEKSLIFCYHPDLEPGVSGIMATRLMERYGKPVVYINQDGKWAKGSARSDGRNILPLLDRAQHLFIQFGGHPEAAGFSIEYDKIPELELLLVEAASTMDLAPPVRELTEHISLQPRQISRALLDELKRMEPFGPGNPEPVIRIPGAEIQKLDYTKDGKHAKFRVRGCESIEFVAWRQADQFRALTDLRVNLYGMLERNLWGRRNKLQFRVDWMNQD
ncbi:MAG: DHH family phosphoesterase [Leptospirales bacterium]|nr:DHH family phosphoesterase [Leptospirales bacterium]